MGDVLRLETILLGIGISLGFLVIEELVLHIRKEKITWLRRIVWIVFGIYVTMVYQATVSLMYGWSIRAFGANINLKPFVVLKTIQANPLNFFGNIIMMVPFGFFLVMLSRRCQNFVITTVAGIFFSASIELVQLFEVRGTDIDDIALNTLGTIIGWWVGRGVIEILPSIRKKMGIYKEVQGRLLLRRKDTLSIGALTAITLCAVMTTGFVQRYQYRQSAQQYLQQLDSMERNQSEVVNANSQEKIADEEQLVLNLVARNAYVLNVGENQCVYEKNGQEKIAPASTTKLLTALVAMKYCNESDEFVVGFEIHRITRDASRAFLCVGARLSFRDALEAMLLPSGNDAAYTVAVNVGKIIAGEEHLSEDEAISYFVHEMNVYAKSLGAISSNFKTPDGYDADGQYTTAHDLSLIMADCLSSPLLMEIMGMEETTQRWESGETITYTNSDELVHPSSVYYREAVLGGKTGTTKEAGACLVFLLKNEEHYYACVVMDSTKNDRFEDAVQICDNIH